MHAHYSTSLRMMSNGNGTLTNRPPSNSLKERLYPLLCSPFRTIRNLSVLKWIVPTSPPEQFYPSNLPKTKNGIPSLSKSLSPVERNYDIHDKEMLAVNRALEEWRHFREGAEHQFEIWTDHKNLEYFMKAKKLNRRQARWSLFLARFDFIMHHRPGKSMGKPDALSRRADHGSGAKDNENIILLTPDFFAVRALEGVELVGAERELLREIRREMD